MGNWNSGRRPNPTKLQQLRGNPGRRRLNQNEPTPPAAPKEFDQVPEELRENAAAAAEWSRTVPILREAGLISTVEKNLLIAMCQEWANYMRASRSVTRDGAVITRKDGTPAYNRNVQAAATSLHSWRTLAQELGLTPSSRSKLPKLKAADQEPSAVDRWKDVI